MLQNNEKLPSSYTDLYLKACILEKLCFVFLLSLTWHEFHKKSYIIFKLKPRLTQSNKLNVRNSIFKLENLIKCIYTLYVLVQFFSWIEFKFPFFQSHYHTLP